MFPCEKSVDPASVGMDAKKVDGVIKLFKKQRANGAFPGGQLVLRAPRDPASSRGRSPGRPPRPARCRPRRTGRR